MCARCSKRPNRVAANDRRGSERSRTETCGRRSGSFVNRNSPRTHASDGHGKGVNRQYESHVGHARTGSDGTVSAALLAQQVADLKVENQRLNERIAKFQSEMQALRIMYGADTTSADDIKGAVENRIRDARRGAPRCAAANTLIEAEVL